MDQRFNRRKAVEVVGQRIFDLLYEQEELNDYINARYPGIHDDLDNPDEERWERFTKEWYNLLDDVLTTVIDHHQYMKENTTISPSQEISVRRYEEEQDGEKVTPIDTTI